MKFFDNFKIKNPPTQKKLRRGKKGAKGEKTDFGDVLDLDFLCDGIFPAGDQTLEY
jgi:hypothetical protein